jgi:alkyl hydroperoxide reductase subunit AhpC
MALRINDQIPNLTVETDMGSFALHDYFGDSWGIVFSHPKDFTPVCTTEFGAVAQLADEWDKRGTKVLGVSVDAVAEHKQWKADIEGHASAKAGRTPADTASVRSVFIISPDKKVQLMMTYPMSVGRNFAEVLRALDGLQATYGTPIATPANWEKGQDVIAALSLDDAKAKEKFGEMRVELPYLRWVKDPS